MKRPQDGQDIGNRVGNGDAATGTARRRERGFAAVYEEMREDILTLRIEPGSAIDEVGLAARFGLSRTPVREALLMLSREALVQFLPSRSAIVAPHSMGNAHEYFDTLALLSRAVTRLAAEVRGEGDIARIAAARAQYEAAVAGNETDAVVAADLAFHRAIAEASGNGFLANFYSLTLDYGRRMLLLYYYPHFDAAERAARGADHRAMAGAIAAGDGPAAEAAASRHVMAELRIIQRGFEPDAGLRFSLDP
ncbi:MAG: GntR family transcriptional regulator [Aquamicrobium sp.]|uniref:GntR family transcriptional regulator n=1 Tax=Aquamicrobium sp. TaxID=1872579 RepID=UPI00349EFCCB|nr:GntR family transcriptional regulator [Aquamicrobium sp.]MCO5159107.1 GntR family transcriptional regulator [Aquamicrobium sp.]